MVKTIFAHPGIQSYRQELFRLLERSGVKFIFTEAEEHNRYFLKKNKSIRNWKIRKDIPLLLPGFAPQIAVDALLEDYDVWMASILTHFTTLFAYPFVRLRGKKFVLWSEDWWVPKKPFAGLAVRFAKHIARSADGVIVAGTKSKKFMVSIGVNPEKIAIAPNSTHRFFGWKLDKRKLNKMRRELGFRKGDFIILYTGRVVRYKGLDVLIRAYEFLKRKFPKAKLLVVGDGQFLNECKNLARLSKVEGISFVGRGKDEDLPYYYSAADVFVHPGRFVKGSVKAESWGFTLNEAASLGLPIVATKAVGAAEDIVRDGKNGFTVIPESPEEITDRLSRLARDRRLARRMGRESKRIAREFMPQIQFNEFSSSLKKIGGGN